MTTTILKKKLTKAINEIDDAGLLQAVYTILEKQLESQPEYALTSTQKKELDRRMANYKAGRTKSYPWEEVKKNLLNRKR